MRVTCIQQKFTNNIISSVRKLYFNEIVIDDKNKYF